MTGSEAGGGRARGRREMHALTGRVWADLTGRPPRGWPRRLKAQLRARLVECGWRDELKAQFQTLVRANGLDRISVDELVREVTPGAQQRVPDAVKAELLKEIRALADGDAVTPAGGEGCADAGGGAGRAPRAPEKR